MTTEERLAALEAQMATLIEPPTEYYTSRYSGEEIDSAVDDVRAGIVIIPSSTSESTKKFQITVDDTGAVSSKEVTDT